MRSRCSSKGAQGGCVNSGPGLVCLGRLAALAALPGGRQGGSGPTTHYLGEGAPPPLAALRALLHHALHSLA